MNSHSFLQKARSTGNNLAWLFTQLFSASPDPSITSGIKMIQWMSKGLLIVGALSSISYTAPTFYNIWSGIFPYWIAQTLTIVCVLLILFLIELSFGALTPFTFEYTFSGQAMKNGNTQAGSVALWVMILFLGGTSMYFTYNGAHTPVHAAIVAPATLDITAFEKQKQKALSKEEARYDAIVDKYHKEDSINLAALKASHHRTIIGIEAYAVNKYGKHSHLVHESLVKARKDSTIKVDDFMSVGQKAPYYVRERNAAINDARVTWNKLIEEKKKQNAETEKQHGYKISAATMLIQNFGAGSTLMFFILQIVVSLLKLGEGGSQKKKFHNL